MCQFYVCNSNVQMYESETIESRLSVIYIGYWNFGNNNQLIGYSVKVHSTSEWSKPYNSC